VVDIILFLILFPCIIALILLFTPGTVLRHWIVKISALVLGVASLYTLAAYYDKGAVFFAVPLEPVSQIMFLIELGLALFIIYMGAKYRNYLAILLILIQSALMVYFEMHYVHDLQAVNNLFIDQFSIIMALIIGIIGSLISVYALRYMDNYQLHHPEVRDRRKFFFFVVFVFLAAMFGLVFSNNLLWMFFFWEITTLASFLLIGYSESEEANKNAFLALNMNLLGGIAFVGAFLYLGSIAGMGGVLEINQLIASGQAIALIPAVLISFAGITKAALMPFSSWLVGAMIAPTPVSALLHSSTMVKAGVYAIVRFAPVLAGSLEGYMIAMVGAVTFLLASCIAISQSNAKKVLAYSTIANLGLIVACAGVGTYKLIWAAILLIIFHAIAKSLLFLCVGTAEHRIGSKDIEDMDGLIVRMPKVAVMMFIGMAGMFLAPFGMLISKWAAIEAFIEAPFGLVFVAILAFGGAVTVFFWSKWMGKIISQTPFGERVEGSVQKEKWAVLYILSGLTILVALLFPLISSVLIEPFILAIYGATARLSQANFAIMVMMIFLLLIMPASLLHFRKDAKHVGPYMGGRPTTTDMHFAGSAGITREMTTRNYYMQQYFGESRLLMSGSVLCTALIFVALIFIVGVIL
jgi:ech hydrogenase subunit A